MDTFSTCRIAPESTKLDKYVVFIMSFSPGVCGSFGGSGVSAELMFLKVKFSLMAKVMFSLLHVLVPGVSI